jgi:DNA-binding LacI/PurR family transcriptional regulator
LKKMRSFHLQSAIEQVADFLSKKIIAGEWHNEMPGVQSLAHQLGVNHKTVEAAIAQLERQGLLEGQGPRRRKRIVAEHTGFHQRSLTLVILTSELADMRLDYIVELQHELVAAGHSVVNLIRSFSELSFNPSLIARMVKKTKADAWIILSGSREILEWFCDSGTPAFSIFGRRRGLPIAAAGPNKPPMMAAATRQLLELGHRRISLLARKRRRLPEPGASEKSFLDTLASHGIEPSPYHLPDWEETVEGYHHCLETLFRHTPPTALIIDEMPFFVATMQFLSDHQWRVPQDVSLICTDSDPAFDWCHTTIAHLQWKSRPIVLRIVRWVKNISQHKKDLTQTNTPCHFILGNTIGPAIKS